MSTATRKREMRAERKALGLCSDCARPAMFGQVRCHTCNQKSRDAGRRFRGWDGISEWQAKPRNKFKKGHQIKPPMRLTAPVATARPNTIDIAWMAGIYEGEGTCSPSGTSQSASVGQKDPWLLLKIQAWCGGTVRQHSSNGMYFWRVNGPRARGFLQTIYPFLSPRRRAQVRRALHVTLFSERAA